MPLTIAWAPFSRANSTSRVEKICTSTLARSAVATSMNAFALLRREQRFVLPQRVVDDADDDLVEDVRGPRDDVEVAEGDRVIGPRADDGSVAFDSLTLQCVDRDVGGPVAALPQPLQRGDRQRAPRAALDHRAPAGCQHPGQVRVQFRPRDRAQFIGGVDEDDVKALRLAGGARQPGPRVGADKSRAVAEPEPLDVAERRAGVAVDQRRAGGAARERLDRQRPGAAVEVEDDGALDPRRRGSRRPPRGPARRSAAPSTPAGRPASGPSALRRRLL